MGVIFSFECPKCGYKDDFSVGGAEGDDKYDVSKMAREKAFEQEILDGKYDEHLKRDYDVLPRPYQFDCNVDFVQCGNCLDLQRITHKRLIYRGKGYLEVIDAEQKCKTCQEVLNMLEFDRTKPICPTCKDTILKVTHLSGF